MEQTNADQSPIGEIQELSGTVNIIHADGSVEPAEEGMPVFEGDVVETDTDGAVNIFFVDESNISLSENAHFSVDEFNFDANSGSGESDFSMLRGLFVYTSGVIGREDPDDVTIETPIGSIGIRGTIIAGQIGENGEDGEITVMEGAIVVRNETGEVTLSNPFETVALNGRNAPIGDVRQISPEDFTVRFASMHNVNPSFFSALGNEAPQGNDAPSEGEAGAAGEPMADEGTEGEEAVEGAEETGEDAATGEEGTEEAGEDTAEDDGTEGEEAADDGGEDMMEAGEEAPADGDAEAPAPAAENIPAEPVLDSSGTLDLGTAAEPTTQEVAPAEPTVAPTSTADSGTEPSTTPTNTTGELSVQPTVQPLNLRHLGGNIDENATGNVGDRYIATILQPNGEEYYEDISFRLVNDYNGFFKLIDLGDYARLVYTGATESTTGDGLNYEKQDSYLIKVLGKTANGQTTTHVFNIFINDVNEAPFSVFDGDSTSLDRAEFVGAEYTTLHYDLSSFFADEDGNLTDFALVDGGMDFSSISVAGNNGGTFADVNLSIDPDNILTIETFGMDFNDTITFELKAIDSDGLSTTKEITLDLIDNVLTGMDYPDSMYWDDVELSTDNETYFAMQGNDTLTIQSNDITAHGGDGEDLLIFDGAFNTYGSSAFGDNGNDDFEIAIGSTSQDFIASGGAGEDEFYINNHALESLAQGVSILDGGLGADTVYFDSSVYGTIDLSTVIGQMKGIEGVYVNANVATTVYINEQVFEHVFGNDAPIIIEGNGETTVEFDADVEGNYMGIVNMIGVTDGEAAHDFYHYQSPEGENLYIDADVNVVGLPTS